MYLRRNRRTTPTGERYDYWTLVESVRTQDGPRQRIVAALGKLPGLAPEHRLGWEHIGQILDGRLPQLDLLAPTPEPPAWATVDTARVRVERLRRFGEVYLGLALWRRLRLDAFFDEAMARGREDVPWSTMACILTLARFCAPSSDLQIADFWYDKTALDDLLGVAPERVNDDRLYRALDALLPHRDRLFGHLQKVYGELFGTVFDLLLYDITSTYFEGRMHGNAQAHRGYSRDSRPDCAQVCIAVVATPEGLPLAYEVFAGNRVDVTTVQEVVETMRTKYGQERRLWVMDRGMVSEENLEQLRAWDARYLVGTPKGMLKAFEQRLLDEDWEAVAPGVEVKLCRAPDGTEETFVLCRSQGRVEKEKAIREKQEARLQQALEQLQARLSAPVRPLRDRTQAERRVGRLLERYPRAARLFRVTVEDRPESAGDDGPRLSLAFERRADVGEWAARADGCYLLRTNLTDRDAGTLWKTYMGLSQVEDCFRVVKHDLGLRPVYHHKAERTQAHILVCFLSLVLWRTLQQWMAGCGLGTAPRKLLEEMAEVRSMDVVLPTGAGPELRLRTVSRPEAHLSLLLDRLQLPLPTKPKAV